MRMVTPSRMIGIYNGLVSDALAAVKAPAADVWVVEAGTKGPFAEASSTVSYTHLDVYKRQGLEHVLNVVGVVDEIGRLDAGAVLDDVAIGRRQPDEEAQRVAKMCIRDRGLSNGLPGGGDGGQGGGCLLYTS